MGLHSSTFEERLNRLQDTTGQIHDYTKVRKAPIVLVTEDDDDEPQPYDRSTLMFSALMVSSFLGVCALGAMAFDLTMSVDQFLDIANK